MTSERNFPDWIEAYKEYASYSEAPSRFHHWTAIATLAGALRRRVWLDQVYFRWFANFYVLLVARPGIVSKTTTIRIGMDLLRQVPGIHFGPSSVTWQALIKDFGEIQETFQAPNGKILPMCALTFESGEFGNLLDPHDNQMVDVMVTLWDGEPFTKSTKGSGCDNVQNPWINMIACTTPQWIAERFPEYMIGGGFTSRCIFIYADEKAKYVPYPRDTIPDIQLDTRAYLIADLTHISKKLCGEYSLSPEAKHWGETWYHAHYARIGSIEDTRFNGYHARKQTHLHKLAMVIAASKRDSLVIALEDLLDAEKLLNETEADMPYVFSLIGRTNISLQAERLINFVHTHHKIDYNEAYRYIHSQFPSLQDFDSVLQGAAAANYLKIIIIGGIRFIVAVGEPPGRIKKANGHKPKDLE